MVSGLILLPQCIICTKRVCECFCPLVRSSPDSITEGGKKKALKKVIMKDAVWKDIHLSLVDEAGEIVKLPLNERIRPADAY